MKRTLLFFTLMFAAYFGLAQVPQVLFYGYVEEGVFEEATVKKKNNKEAESKKLSNVKIFIYAGDSVLTTADARSTGFYAVLLDAGEKYRVVFEREGYFCKCFELDCRNLEYDTDEGALKCLTDVSLFKTVDNADLLSLCKVPYARSKYDEATKSMLWDMEYTQKARDKFYELAEPYYLAQKK
ncbi:MAG: hypothetical protein JNM00_03565 [Flavobacteriales bacterium]|nr:hypothetical protein [Flavobacteriales bacterium]